MQLLGNRVWGIDWIELLYVHLMRSFNVNVICGLHALMPKNQIQNPNEKNATCYLW